MPVVAIMPIFCSSGLKAVKNALHTLLIIFLGVRHKLFASEEVYKQLRFHLVHVFAIALNAKCPW